MVKVYSTRNIEELGTIFITVVNQKEKRFSASYAINEYKAIRIIFRSNNKVKILRV